MNAVLPEFPGDREPLAHFAGREFELAQLNSKLNRVIQTKDGGGGITLVTGVPGVGKTTLIQRFAKNASESNPRVKVLNLKALDLSHPVSTALAISDAAGMPETGRMAAEVDTSTAQLSGGVGAFGVQGKAGASFDRKRVSKPFPAMMRDIAQAWDHKRAEALIIVVDELQNLPDDARDVIRTLHEGVEGCPLAFIAGGLQHTPSRLAELGISRTNIPLTLGNLSHAGAREAFQGNAEIYAGASSIPENAMSKLVDASHCFPQHIHGYLEGIVDVTRERGGRALESKQALQDALAHGDRRRAEYYNGRLSVMGRHALPALIVAGAMASDGISWDEARHAIDQWNRGRGEESQGDVVIETAIRHGVFTPDNLSHRLTVDIPSFHTHMAERLRTLNNDHSRGKGMTR